MSAKKMAGFDPLLPSTRPLHMTTPLPSPGDAHHFFGPHTHPSPHPPYESSRYTQLGEGVGRGCAGGSRGWSFHVFHTSLFLF